MYFKRLEMHGFKSFAEPVVIEFHEGVTCIVGPNGSGKSNISDAIRWVLGEQSPKALRGGKMEEVIFNGTASRKSRGMAEVTLVIDNSTGILEIDYNEVAITRRMFRSGESEYLINNNQCRLRDIRELIMDTGIGVDGYSLIGQGKIADIVSNKPESRREIFEEAAGVVLYKSKKADAERKLASTTGNLDRVNDIVGEIEDRIDALKEDSTKAKEYLELKEKYRDLEINITLKNIDNINLKNESFTNDIADFSEKIESITTEKNTVDEKIEKARSRGEILDQLGNESRDKLLATVEEINKHTNQSQLNEERLTAIEKDSIRIKEEIGQLTEKLSGEEKNKSELEKSEKEIESRLIVAKDELQTKIEKYNHITGEFNQVSKDIEDGKNNLYRLHSLTATKKSEKNSIESMKNSLSKRKAQLGEDASNTVKSGNEQDSMLKKAEEMKSEEEKNLEEYASLEKKLGEEIGKNAEKQRTLSVEIEDLKIKGSQLSTRKKTIEEMENNYEGYNYAVKYIMKAGIPGLDGVIAELMEVPSDLNVAVETALGGAMQNIVCGTDQDAKKGVNKLKESRAGRLTFLPVGSIKGKTASLPKEALAYKGFKGIASDCIKYDERYRNIFEFLLGRVIIVDTMDSAIYLSKIIGNGVRLVTAEGEIISGSGAITGGQYKNKSANLLERKAEINQLENAVRQISEKLQNSIEEQKLLTERMNSLNGQREELEKSKRAVEMSLVQLDSQIASLKDGIKTIEENNDKYSVEFDSIEKELKDADKLISDTEVQLAETEREIKTLNDSLDGKLNDYDKLKQEVAEANEEITKTRIASNEWETKRDNMGSLIKRIKDAADDYRFQIETKKTQLSDNEKEKNSILFGSEGSTENIEKLIKEKSELEDYISKVTAEKTEINRGISEILKEQQSIGAQINSYQDQKYQMEIKLAKNETQLDTLKDRLWEDFEISYAQAEDFRKPDFVMGTSVRESREIRNRMRELGDVNVGAIKEYESVSQRYAFLTEQRRDIMTAMDELKSIISDMDATIKKKFKENFDQVVVNFESIFKELFGGGHAELRMEDENNPLESGIDIIAQPPGKKLQNINLLSGGEKTMTAIALMFAVLKTKPTPFCILDEVEAALDDANIDRFSKYLRKFTDIQFTLVTHQKATMEHADVLYGVTMPEQGISKVLSLRLGDDFEI